MSVPAHGELPVRQRARRQVVKVQSGCVYLVRLCSGEERHWCYEGSDARDTAWWRDVETGISFSESSLLYVWEIVREEGKDGGRPAAERD